ncbi:hypothetical protein CCP4SC76_7520004 [Gammaproteobacteria bacterium]
MMMRLWRLSGVPGSRICLLSDPLETDLGILSLLLTIPALGALAVGLIPRRHLAWMRGTALAAASLAKAEMAHV